MHPTVELVNLVVAFLNDNARTWRASMGNPTVKNQPVPGLRTDPNGAVKLANWRIIVSPMKWDGELLERSGSYDDDHQVTVGFMRSLPEGVAWDSDAGADWINARLSEVGEVLTDLRENAIALGDYRAAQWTHDVIASPERLQQGNLFISIVRGAFMQLT